MTSDQGQKVKDQGHTLMYRISSKNAINRQRTVRSTSNFVEIFKVRLEAHDTLSTSAGQLDRK